MARNVRIVEGEPCKKCGNCKYYAIRKVCVTCHMQKKSTYKELARGWPKRINFQKAMDGVWYD